MIISCRLGGFSSPCVGRCLRGGVVQQFLDWASQSFEEAALVVDSCSWCVCRRAMCARVRLSVSPACAGAGQWVTPARRLGSRFRSDHQQSPRSPNRRLTPAAAHTAAGTGGTCKRGHAVLFVPRLACTRADRASPRFGSSCWHTLLRHAHMETPSEKWTDSRSRLSLVVCWPAQQIPCSPPATLGPSPTHTRWSVTASLSPRRDTDQHLRADQHHRHQSHTTPCRPPIRRLTSSSSRLWSPLLSRPSGSCALASTRSRRAWPSAPLAAIAS